MLTVRGGAVRAAGRFATVASVVAMASGGLLATAAPAGAASISAPSVITSAAKVTIIAHTDAVQGAELVFNGKVVRSAGPLQLGSTLSYTFATAPLRNGSYRAALRQQLATLPWYTAAWTTIRLRIPPAVPTGVGAHLVTGRVVRVTWAKGTEPDLSSYDVLSTSLAEVTGLGVRSVCAAATCAAMVTVPAAAGPSVGFAVVARRSDGAGGTLASAASPLARVYIPGAAGAGGGGGRQPGIAAGGLAGRVSGFGTTGSYGRRYLPMEASSDGGSPLVLHRVGPGDPPLMLSPGRTVGARAARPSLAAGAGYVVTAVVIIALLALAHVAVWRWRRERVWSYGFSH